jgi:hypothetical protein
VPECAGHLQVGQDATGHGVKVTPSSYGTSCEVCSERSLLDVHELTRAAAKSLGLMLIVEDKRVVRPCSQRLQQKPLVSLEADLGPLMRGAVDPHIRRPVQPEQPLVIQIRIIQGLAAIDQVTSYVADGTLDLGPGPAPRTCSAPPPCS